jgi:hypothetical protein
MARLQTGALVSAISGRCGQLVFRQTRFGIVVQTAAAPPDYHSPDAVLSRQRFACAVRTWGRMPDPLKKSLSAVLTSAGKGTPGPWCASVIAFARGGAFEFRHATDSHVETLIVSVIDSGTYWTITYTPPLVAPWDRFYVAFAHPVEGPPPSLGWFSTTPVGGELHLGKVPLPAGSFFVMLPTITGSPERVGIGDARFLP